METKALQQELSTVCKEVMPETCELVRPIVKVVVPAPRASETNTFLELQKDFVPQPRASSGEKFSEDHGRSLLVKKCPQGLDMDPLCSFLMLRARQASPVSEANQSS